MTSLTARAVAGRSGEAERLDWPPVPTPLGLLESRGDLGESGGTAAPPCIIIDGSIADPGPTAAPAAPPPPPPPPPPPLAFAFCTRHPTSATVSGRVSQCANSRSSTTLSAGAPGAGISGGSCSRSTCSASASAAALRSAASIPPLSSPSPPIRSGRTRGAAWRGESELGVARGA
ncbi:Os02g0191650, partial [Oryza sativa Japonica Group]